MHHVPGSRSRVFVVVAAVVLVGLAVWAVSARSRPAFAVYDTLPAALHQDSPGAPPPRDSDRVAHPAAAGSEAISPERTHAATREPPRAASAPVPAPRADTATTDSVATRDSAAVRPHRSDNYGGYSGYGSRERRGDTHAR
ncbi:MAG TPA: hypothetical protein VJ847_10060 [Gemmatimonadales bacterium]|jgi:hypothetical protein|nr:hypothetical protein [Gemmatimonadales bacterium]